MFREVCLEEETLTAYHEAGHAFAALFFGGKVLRVSIDPENDGGRRRYGETVVKWNPRRFSDREMAELSVIVALAGPTAEMICQNEPVHPAYVAEWADDWKQAMDVLQFIPSVRKRVEHLEKAVREIHRVFMTDSYWEVIAAIADALLAHEILDEEMLNETVEPWMGQ